MRLSLNRPSWILVGVAAFAGALNQSRAHDPTPAESNQELPALAASTGNLRPLLVAISDHTVTDEPLPTKDLDRIVELTKSLGAEHPELIKVTDRESVADWLIHAASPERPDIIYLAPTERFLPGGGEDALQMAPPGEEPLAWLESRLAEIARARNLLAIIKRPRGATTVHGQGNLHYYPTIKHVDVKIDVDVRKLRDREDRVGKPFESDGELVLHDGELFGVVVSNPNEFPVYVSALFVDAKFQIHSLAPASPDAKPIRLEPKSKPGASAMPVRSIVNAETKGLERLVVIAVEAGETSAPDFTVLAAEAPPSDSKSKEHSLLVRFITTAVFTGQIQENRSNTTWADFDMNEFHGACTLAWKTADAEETHRTLGFFRKGPAEDLKAQIVREQSGVYHTNNRTQAVLGTYGKFVKGNKVFGEMHRFEHRGLIEGVERARRFLTVQKRGSDGGKDFVSFVGNRQAWQVVDLAAGASGGKKQSVEYELLGVRLDQSDVVRTLNADRDALAYFDYVRTQNETPCVVLENVMLVNYAASNSTQVGANASAKLPLDVAGAGVNSQRERSSFTQFAAPIVRCYQMYEVKSHQGQVMELVALEP